MPPPDSVSPDNNRALVCRTFCVGTYGSPRKALKAAQEWRDQTGAKLYGQDLFSIMLFRGRSMPKRKPRGRAIEPGITVSAGGRGITATWTVWQKKQKKRKSKSFSIQKYGREEALKLAREARQAGLEDAFCGELPPSVKSEQQKKL